MDVTVTYRLTNAVDVTQTASIVHRDNLPMVRPVRRFVPCVKLADTATSGSINAKTAQLVGTKKVRGNFLVLHV